VVSCEKEVDMQYSNCKIQDTEDMHVISRGRSKILTWTLWRWGSKAYISYFILGLSLNDSIFSPSSSGLLYGVYHIVQQKSKGERNTYEQHDDGCMVSDRNSVSIKESLKQVLPPVGSPFPDQLQG
jgi:hypothetical protein